jgi:hypothetical protein
LLKIKTEQFGKLKSDQVLMEIILHMSIQSDADFMRVVRYGN